MEVSEKIKREVDKHPDKINSVAYGRITFIVQDKTVVRVEVQDGWIPEKEE